MRDAIDALATRGPVEETEWPTRVRGHVVDPGPPARLHGYAVAGDLASHYRFASVVLLSLTGELPDAAREQLFECALICASAVSVADAPAHAAGLARLVGASSSSVIEVGAIGLGERAWFIVSRHKDWLAWLESSAGPIPDVARETGSGVDARVLQLRSVASAIGLDVPGLGEAVTWDAGLLATLWACGLRKPPQIETALVVAALATVAAEGHAWPRGRFREYPMNTPVMRYDRGAP
jgi:hypothetical protein